MQVCLESQKAAHLRDGTLSAETRIAWTDRCIGMLVDHQTEIEDALNADFGSRSREASAFTDVASSIGTLKHAEAHVRQWMKPEKRKATSAILWLLGAKCEAWRRHG